MMQESFAGMIKQIAQDVGGRMDVISCTVASTKPLKLKFDGDAKITLDKENLVIPRHITGLRKGSKVNVVGTGDGDGYMIVGRG